MFKSFDLAMLQKTALISLVVATPIALIGCGGSQGQATPSTPSSLRIGNMSVRISGTPKPQFSFSSSGVTVSGIGGVNISALSLSCPQVLLNSNIAFARGGQIWVYNPVTSRSAPITTLPANAGFSGGPSWSNNGNIVFSTIPAGTQAAITYKCAYDGSNLSTMPTGTHAVVQRPAFAPDGAHIAGYDTAGNLCVETNTGSSQTQLVASSAMDVQGTVGWLNASTIVFQEPVSGSEELFTIPVGGGTATQLKNFNNTSTTSYDLETAVSSAGTAVAYLIQVSNSATGTTTNAINVVNLANGATQNITPTLQNYEWPSFAPNSAMLAFTGQDSAVTNDGTFGVYTCLLNGEQPTLIAADPNGQGGPLADQSTSPRWQPFPPKSYSLIAATGGLIGTFSSGFLQAQADAAAFPCVVSYTAQTPSDVQVIPPTNNSGPLVFTITADTIKSISWENGVYLPIQTLSPTSTTGFLVSIDSTDGQIGLIAPFAIKASGSVSKVRAPVSNGLSYAAHFTGLYDRNGKNIAPSGASEVAFDSRTGRLTTWH